jgi:hypothetical protein
MPTCAATLILFFLSHSGSQFTPFVHVRSITRFVLTRVVSFSSLF